MVRCDEFYKKWDEVGNFCEKHPRTAERIESYLDQILGLLKTEVSKSEILDTENTPIGAILTEGASRPLVSEESPKVKREAVKQIVKLAEEKVIVGTKPQVTENEVKQVVQQIKSKPEYKSTFNETNDNIEWARYSWNPVTGCKHGCPYCYARDIGNRFQGGFEPKFHENRLNASENTELPSDGLPNVFVCSMADLFGDWVPQEWINKVINKVESNPQWNFIFLTKNPKRLVGIDWPDNAWVGTTIDIQSRVSIAETAMKQVNAKVRFYSCEPLMEQVTFDDLTMINWIIIGGRSQSAGMPAGQPEWDWVESLIWQARKNNVKIYFKPNLTVRPREYPTRER